MAVRVRNPGYNWYQGNNHSTNGWYNNTTQNYNRRSVQNYNRRSANNSIYNNNYDYRRARQNNFGNRPHYNRATRQRYGYGYKRPNAFGKVLISAGILAGKAIHAGGTLAKKSFYKAKDYTDSVKANKKDREANIYYTDNVTFNDLTFDSNEMLEILDVPANSLMCATESGVKFAQHCAELLVGEEKSTKSASL